jgi:uncharacterized protein YdiU (UPF0061 family)
VVTNHDALSDCLKRYALTFNRLHVAAFLTKLGLSKETAQGDALVSKTLQMLHESKADMTVLFRRLSHAVLNGNFSSCADVCVNSAAFDAWLPFYQAACEASSQNLVQRSTAMLAVNPKYVLRNHLAETAIRQARDHQDNSEIHTLLKLLAHPFDEQIEYDAYAALPPDWAQQLEVSCSS